MISVLFFLGYLGTLAFVCYRWTFNPVDGTVIQREIILPAVKEFMVVSRSSPLTDGALLQ